MSEHTAENAAAYAQGMAHGLGETLEYITRHGTADLHEWLDRRARGWQAAADEATRVIPPEETGEDA